MKWKGSPDPSERSKRFRRSLSLVAVVLVVSGVAVFTRFMNGGVNSSRFALLHNGMTFEEVSGTLKPSMILQEPVIPGMKMPSALVPRRATNGIQLFSIQLFRKSDVPGIRYERYVCRRAAGEHGAAKANMSRNP